MTGATPSPTVWPTLRARDARALIRFLVDVLGFEETVLYADGDVVHHAELAWPLGGGVMLGSSREDGGDLVSRPGSASAYVVMDDPDERYARVTAAIGDAGGEIVRPLSDTDYGSRDFAVRDPEGNIWSFGTYAGHPR
jgi:uncharacterized glyoxalase superfamily protein PhnB